MRIPRDLDGADLVRRLRAFGYEQTRQTGSHVRVTRIGANGEHHLTVPLHNPMRVGTLNAILNELVAQLEMDKAELIERLR